MSVTGPDSNTPAKVSVAVVDIVTGLHAPLGILAALRHRDRTGEGQRVEVYCPHCSQRWQTKPRDT